MSSPVNHENLIFASNQGKLCEISVAYLQAISVLRAFLNYTIDKDDNSVQVGFLKDVAYPFPFLYGTAENENNAYSITFPVETHPQYSSLADITGKPIFLRIQNSNTGASTLAIGSTAAVNIYAGDQSLYEGALRANSIAVLIYDGTVYRLLNPDAKTLVSQVKSTEPVALPSKPGNISIVRPSGAYMVKAVIVAQSGVGGGYSVGEAVEIGFLMEDTGNSGRTLAFSVTESEGSWRISRSAQLGGSNGTEIISVTDGTRYRIDDSQWRIRIDYI